MEKRAFASDKPVHQMMTQMEDMYAAAFGRPSSIPYMGQHPPKSSIARGDKKQANKRLRTGGSTRTHHFSAFRAGMYLGLGIPALFQGLVRGTIFCSYQLMVDHEHFLVFQTDTQQAVPAWDMLLFVYGIILIPVLFSLLVGINLLVWAESRINYSFIFG